MRSASRIAIETSLQLVFWSLAFAVASAGAEDAAADGWRYTFARPADGWQQTGFDDSQWKQGVGGFGTHGTPGARVGTAWSTGAIWLRKAFELPAVPAKPALLLHHDEDVEIYINGRQVAALDGWQTQYRILPLDEDGRQAVRAGENLLAVHCRQTTGGQYVDVHVVDADNPPKLSPPRPFQSELMTTWGAQVDADNAWTEYPRPQLKRPAWQNLNGRWDYAVTSDTQTDPPSQWDGRILVPFCLESKLGGVQKLLDGTEALWYRRTFRAPREANERTLLHFEAVDYRCQVFVNGQSVGTHQGGNTPFTFDVTDALRGDPQQDQSLVVRVEDDTQQWQLHGKQVLDPHGIWYTRVSGIWQTVWLERVPVNYLVDLSIKTDAETGTISIQSKTTGDRAAQSVRVEVQDGDESVGVSEGPAQEAVAVQVRDARLWSPRSPHLYRLEVSLLDAEGRVIDQVESYAGIRSVGKVRDADGHWRMTLNGEILFHLGPLDQGWWPDGLLTPPSDEAMVFDIEYLKAAGFNMIRKHIKVEPRRYYYHCDRLGMMLWQDQVSAGHNPPWTRLDPEPTDADWPEEQHRQFRLELERMIDGLENHPSIVVWVPFNEAWGQHRTVEVGKWMVGRDPSRLVNIASGGNFWPVGDIVDHHSYPHPEFPFDARRYQDFIKVVGEFGGHGYPVPGHLWDANRDNWGYGGLPKTKAEYRQRYVTSLEKLAALKRQGIAAGVYTQTTDVEGEINGLMTYDRKVIKIPAEELSRLHRGLIEP
jgi:beta-galactosidase